MRKTTKLQGDAGGLVGLRTGANELKRIGGFREVLLTKVQQTKNRATEAAGELVLAIQTLDLEAVRSWT